MWRDLFRWFPKLRGNLNLSRACPPIFSLHTRNYLVLWVASIYTLLVLHPPQAAQPIV